MSGYALGEPYGGGRSFQQLIRGTAPAAGSSFTTTVSGFFRSRLIGAVFALTTDANAANRYVTVECLQDDNTPFLLGAGAVTVTANTTAQRFAGSMYTGSGSWNTGTDVMFPLLPLWIMEGQTLKINVASIQVGDTLTNIRLLFDRFPTAAHWFDASDQQ